MFCENCGNEIKEMYNFVVCDCCESEICSKCIDGKEICPICGNEHSS